MITWPTSSYNFWLSLSHNFFFSKILLLPSLSIVLVSDHAWLQRKSSIGHLQYCGMWHSELALWYESSTFFSYFLPSTDQPTIILNPGLHILMILRHQVSPAQFNVSFRMLWVRLLFSHWHFHLSDIFRSSQLLGLFTEHSLACLILMLYIYIYNIH